MDFKRKLSEVDADAAEDVKMDMGATIIPQRERAKIGRAHV